VIFNPSFFFSLPKLYLKCFLEGANEVLPDSSSHLDNGIVNHDPSSHVSRHDADPDAPILPTAKPRLQHPTKSIADGQGKSEASSAHMSKWVGIGVGVGVGAIVLLVSSVVRRLFIYLKYIYFV